MQIKLEQKVLQAIRKVVGKKNINLHEPSFTNLEFEHLQKCIKSGYVSSIGSYVTTFENKLKMITKAKYVIPVVNGTAALHISLSALDILPNDEILIPSLTFIATANAVSYVNAIPHFVDIEEQTLGIDPFKLRNYLKKIVISKNKFSFNKMTGRRIRCLIPLHTFGHACNILELKKVASEFNLLIVEDAAEALGSSFKGKQLGTFGDFGALSFNGNKIITTGGGGAVLTNNIILAKRALKLSSTAKLKHDWEFIHDEIGFNYRMPNINAALGCAQLEKLDKFIKDKRNLYQKYEEEFKCFNDLYLFKEPQFAKSNYWLNTIILSNSAKYKKNSILKYTNLNGIRTRPAWKLMSTLKPYKNTPKSDLRVSKSLYDRIINIPSSHFLNNS